MNIYEYLLVDGVTGGTVVADRYEAIGNDYVFFLKKYGIERDVYRIPVDWLWELKCLTCEAA